VNLFAYIKNGNIEAIKTDHEYKIVLEAIDAMIEAEPGSPEWDRLELLSLLVSAYEKKSLTN
tara:strand:+ start:3465 stop:3650 length:186 start_codon:yes stop_codon:yes gene_type:complete